ncbi:MAG TPA: ABC transporter ATP-binding protein [Usitatibacter sp.]|nr:ABC transporter ATP-binding protein [Usitatibacter sp.]
MTLLSVRNLSKRFGDRLVLQDVSFDVAEGEVHGIMGPNGAGKTTCFHVLTGRYKPDGGQVTFRGADVTGLAPRRIARLGIARSFQVMNLFDDYTALENAVIATPEFRARGFDALADASAVMPARERAIRVLADVGLAGKEGVRAKSLSYGDRRALEIGVALAADPGLLFLDEPTAGLGAEGLARVAELIRRLRGRLTLVIIEHDMRFLFGLADRISVVHWGQVIARGTPAELQANPWVQRSALAGVGAY